ncbi:MAG: hypothetical protein Q9187_004937 [Circinaria calcarea]
MTDRALQHRRTHNLLLLQRFLTLREGSSPFTLVLDSLEQSGRPLVREYVQRAKTTKIGIVYVSFETPRPQDGVTTVVNARRKDSAVLQKEISASCLKNSKNLLIIDTLHPLASKPSMNLATFLSSLITPTVSLLAIYHLDIPLSPHTASPYHPSPLTLLKYLATTIFTVHSLSQVLARKRAADRSLAEPVFGLAEETEGVLVGLGANDPRGLVLEMEHRRKSGREIEEWFFLPASKCQPSPADRTREKIMLLEDHPLYRPQVAGSDPSGEVGDEDSTFSLGLTEKQRRDRENVVLPYFDAQKDGGGGGGRILYDMGVEDDFDEEEDEI